MSVSILAGIATRNRADILPKALASVLAQTAPNLQVAVIDDGSTDATAELPARFPQVRWTRRRASSGYMSARNELMATSGFDYFVSLDDDAWFLLGDEISVAVDFLERNPGVAAIAFDILSPDRPNSVPRGEPRPAAMFIGCGHVLRLSAIRSVGVYEAAPGSWGSEEKDLCLRLMDADFQIVRLPGVHVWHDKTTLARQYPAQYRSSICNDLTMTFRRTPVWLLPPALSLKLGQHALAAWKRGATRLYWEGIILFARFLPQTWRLRRPVKLATLRAFRRLSRIGNTESRK